MKLTEKLKEYNSTSTTTQQKTLQAILFNNGNDPELARQTTKELNKQYKTNKKYNNKHYNSSLIFS
jgi:hypothetical protein